MVKTLSCNNQIIYAFSKDNKAVKHVDTGETIEIETYDCFENQVKSAEDKIASIDWSRINPATGPIHINGAEKGDILKVKINKITLADQGVIATGPDLGVMGHKIEAFTSKIVPIENEQAIFNDKIKIPLNPMIGVIGVAPEGEPVPTGTPGAHGGNMDTQIITEGAEVYFPVFTDGALFALGDFHAAMGDGEVGGSGIEIPGHVSVTFDLIKGRKLEHPVIVNDDGISFIVTADTIDEAINQAGREAVDFLFSNTDLSLEDLAMLMSAVGQAEICQIVNPLMTARFFVPQYILDTYSINPFK